MRALPPLFALAALARAVQVTHDAPRRQGLVVHRVLDGECTWVATRPGQTYKGSVRHDVRFVNARGQRVEESAAVTEQYRLWFTEGEDARMQDTVRAMCGEHALGRGAQSVFSAPAPALRVEPLIVSGPSSNRVDLTFFADGYTADEHGKFIADARRLADDISANTTFAPVRPLLNFWAAFVPSAESGIGVGGHPKDTPFGLYRDGTELRGVYYAKPDAARAACHALGDRCDYPILVGNDDLYGGLGGEFTVITPSLANGPLVLRHELGHSIIDVGEEYDGGVYEGYFGVNAAPSASNITWAHWLTHSDKEPRVERSAMPFQAYAWTLLNTSSAWAANFNSSGAYARHTLRFSLSGLPRADDLVVRLDGADLRWAPRKDIGRDRWHYDIKLDTALCEGAHEVKFELRNGEREGEAQLCSVEVLEFGAADEFNATRGAVGAFPTFANDGRAAVRPTDEGCLMRQVTTPDFCAVCMEGLWARLLARVDLVDAAGAVCVRGERVLSVQLVPLGQFRDGKGKGEGERYRIRWTRDGVEKPEWEDEVEVRVRGEEGMGHWRADVRFESDQIRKDKEGVTRAGVQWVVDSECA